MPRGKIDVSGCSCGKLLMSICKSRQEIFMISYTMAIEDARAGEKKSLLIAFR